MRLGIESGETGAGDLLVPGSKCLVDLADDAACDRVQCNETSMIDAVQG